MDSRCTLLSTKQLVSDKVAKVLTAKNALYEKQLSDVCKKLDKEKSYCRAAIENTKRNLIKTLSAKGSLHAAKKSPSVDNIDNVHLHERSYSLPTSSQLKLIRTRLRTRSTDEHSVTEKGNALSSVIAIPGIHRREYTTANDNASLSPKSLSSTDTEDDVFGGLSRSHASESEIPDILITDLDSEDSTDVNVDTIENKPLRKMSLVRSYSTGDMENTAKTVQKTFGQACSSPVRIRRNGISDNVHGQSWKEENVIEDQVKYGSLDELVLKSFSNVPFEHNIPPEKPKPRFKLYSEEPFYLRKKCLLRRSLDRKDIHKSAPEGLQDGGSQEKEESFERPLASILPPIVLPSISTQERYKNAKAFTGSRKFEHNLKLTADVSNLTKHLTDCRYLRSYTQ